MKKTRITGTEFMVEFVDHDERAKFFVTNGFKYKPNSEVQARWVAENNGGDKSRLVIMTPLDPELRCNLRALTMRARVEKKEARGVVTFA